MNPLKKYLLKSSLIRSLTLILLLASLQACDELGEAACSFFTGDCSDSVASLAAGSKFYDIRDAEYNVATDEIVAVTLPAPAPSEIRVDGPFYLVTVDPISQLERRVELPLPPRFVSIGPSGMDAVVALSSPSDVDTNSGKGSGLAMVVYIDLMDMEIIDTHTVTGMNGESLSDVVLDGNGDAHVFSRTSVSSVDLMTGTVTPSDTGLGFPKAKLAPGGNSLLVINNDTLQRFGITMGVASYAADSPSGRDLGQCFPDDSQGGQSEEALTLSIDGSVIFTPCGDVFDATDMTYIDTIDIAQLLDENSDNGTVRHMAAYDEAHPFVGLSYIVLGPFEQPTIGFFDLESRDLDSVLLAPRPSASNNPNFIFYNSDGTRIASVIRGGVTANGPTTYVTQIRSYLVP